MYQYQSLKFPKATERNIYTTQSYDPTININGVKPIQIIEELYKKKGTY